jgi:hypothetical protein
MNPKEAGDLIANTINKPKKIAVCTAWGSPFCWTKPTYNMANLLRPEGVEVLFLPGFGWCPARRHMQGVEKALKWGATHICFLGPDQIHPLDILLKFTKHTMDGWPVVCARVPSRGKPDSMLVTKPYQEIAYKWKKDVKFKEFSNSALELVKEEDGSLQEIAVIGTGAIMFNADLLQSLRKPWFKEFFSDKESYDRHLMMDTMFVYRLGTEGNARILCDLTIKILHVDVFPIDPSYADRFEDMESRVESGFYEPYTFEGENTI